MASQVLRGAVLAGAVACLAAVPSRSVATMPPECAGIVALLDTQYAMFNAFVDADAAAVMAGMERVPALAVIIAASPPDDIAPSVEIWLANNVAMFRLLEGLSDPNAIWAALRDAPPAPIEVPQAQRAVEAWAEAQCGWSVPATALTPTTSPAVTTTSAPAGQVPEPPDCGRLDPAVAAQGAALDIDPSDADTIFEGGGAAFRTNACSYGDGAMYLTTISFTDVAAASREMIDIATTVGGGAVLDVDIGRLPASTTVIGFDQAVQVIVFESTIPFAVTVAGAGIDPATAVSAADALDLALSVSSPDTSVGPAG